jgi:hypothetical protein
LHTALNPGGGGATLSALQFAVGRAGIGRLPTELLLRALNLREIPNYLEVDYLSQTTTVLYLPTALFELNPLVLSAGAVYAQRVYN